MSPSDSRPTGSCSVQGSDTGYSALAMSCAAAPASLPAVRLQVDLLRPSLGALTTDDVLLVASELATNAVRHAATSFTIQLRLTPSGVLVLIQDGSLRLPEIPPENDLLRAGGRGLLLVWHLSSQYGYSTSTRLGQKVVWALVPWNSADDPH